MITLRLVDLLNTLLSMCHSQDRWHEVPTSVEVVVSQYPTGENG